MEDKNTNPGVVSPGDASGQVSPPIAFDPQALSEQPSLASNPIAVQGASRQAGTRLKWGTLIAGFILLLGGVGFVLLQVTQKGDSKPNNSATTRFDATILSLDGIEVQPIVNLSNTKTVVINGTLNVKDGLVIAPTVQPATAQVGQIYYDINENTLAYFNGTEFVSVGGDVVKQLGGLTGNVALGGGLSVVAGQLANSGVLSVQGQTGNVAFTAGNGITIDGTTISNAGVVSVTSSSPAITVTDDGNGNITLGGSGSGTISSLGGTTDRIAKFTGAQSIGDSLLGESGSVVTVNGDLTVIGAINLSSPLSIASGGTGTSSLGANGVLVGNGTSAITSVVAGSAGLCLVSTAGAPTWTSCSPASAAVDSLNGLTGNLTIANATGLVDTITIDDASTSNKGIVQFNGGNFSVSGGNVNTIQNISTGSSPTFNSMTLSGNLTVQGGTSTLGTLTQAGSLVVSDGSSNTVTVVAANLSANRTYTLPDAGGDATLCVTAGNCIGGSGGAPNGADYLVTSLSGTLTNERAIANGSNITLTDGGANGSLTVATVQNPTFTTSVTTPALQSSGALVLTSAAGNTVAIDAATTIELQDSTNVTGTLDVSLALNAGTGNAFAVNSSGVITAAAGITSSGTIVFSDLDCSGNVNGGTLTTDGSGQLICSDDDGGGGGGGITGSGSGGTIPVFNGATSITNSIITQSGTTITITGDLTLNTDLTVSNGGTGASSFTSNGVLYGNGGGTLQVTSAGTGGQVLIANATGVPTFASFSGDVTVSNTGVTAIQANSVALGTDTVGDYVTNLGALTGLSTSGNAGEGSTPTLSVSYGSIANTAVQGNVTLTCPSGTGNLTGGGTSITLGTGGSCGNLNTVNNPTFTTSVTTPSLVLTGAGNNGSIAVGNLGQGTVYTLPDPNQATVDICLATGNCATAGAAGGDLTGTYPNPTIAKFQGTGLDISSPLAGHILVYNSTNGAWENHAVTSDIAISETGVATVQSNAVALGGDTTGNYVIGLTAGNGISVSGSVGEGWSPSVAVLYGSSANTAVEGNTSLTVTAGTNMTGGGSITLGTGGSVTLNVANSPTFSGILTVQGATATVGTPGQQGSVVLSDGSSNTVSIVPAAFGNNRTYTLPDVGGNADICLSTGNCAGTGGGITGSGTPDQLSKFTGSGTIGDSLLSDDGSTVTVTGSGNFVVQGGTASLGTLTQAGALSVSDGSNNTVSIVAAAVAANRTFTLPETGGPATFCMSTGNCVGGGGGSAPSDAEYLVLNLNGSLSNERSITNGSNIAFTDGGANSTLTVATVQNPTFTTSVTTPALQSSNALTISSGGSDSITINAGTTIELQDSTNVNGVLDVSASLNVGTSNAFAVNSSGAITAATGITSSGTITFSGLDCTTFANGGNLTTDGSGVLSCSDDDGAAANAITGTGTSGTVALFNGTNTLTDSIITQTGGNTIAIAGTLTLTNDLSVANGGTGASSFTSNGVLYGNGSGAIQVTTAGTGGQVLIANATGVPTFTTFSGDIAVSNTGVTAIQANSVALGTDTAGDYVATLGSLTGLSTTGNSGEGSTPTLSVLYGSGANTAVQGNTTLTCPSGTGNLTGGGTSITLGTGGSCANLNTVSNPTFTTSVTTPSLVLTGAGNNGSLAVANLNQATTYTLPDPGQATATFCLSTNNCTATGTAGGDLVGSYPNPTIAELQGTTLDIDTPTAGHTLVYNGTTSAWENHAVSGDIAIGETGVTAIQANSVALGTDTTGDYVANIGSLTGLSTTANSGEGSTPTLSVLYGSSANTAVQGNVTLTCPSGTGNLTGGGTSIILGAGGSCGNITITNSPTFTGTLTVNTIDTTGSLTVGDTAQTFTLQGNATSLITADDSGNTTTIGFVTPTADTTISFPALPAGTNYVLCTSSGNCGGVGVTLQTAYSNSTSPEITLDNTRAALTIRDNSTPVGGNLFEVQNNGGSTTYFAVDSAGIGTTGNNTSSGNVNSTGGGIQTNTVTRIDNSGNLVSIGNITADGNITLFDNAAGDTITLGDSLAATQDTVTLNGDLNFGTDTDADTIVLGDTGNADTFSLNSSGLRISTVGSLTNVGANITAGGALTVASGSSSALNLTGSASSTWTVGGGNTLGITSSNLNVSTGGVLNIVGGSAGFQIGGAATNGNFLRGNGISFVSSAIQAADIPDLGSSYIKNQTAQQTSANFNILSGNAGSIGAQIQGAASQTAATMVLKGGATPGANADLLQLQTSSATVGKFDNAGNLLGANTATATTGTTTGTGTNTTTLTLTADAFSTNDVVLIDNAGQDYYTRITADPGTGSYTVSPAVTFEASRTVTKYTIQNIGATSSDYTSQTNRYFQGYFLGGVVAGAGSTTLSDSRLNSTGRLNLNSTDVVVQNSADSTAAMQIQNAAGTAILTADTTNKRISIGTIATATGQLYVAGQIPVDVGNVATDTAPFSLVVNGSYAYVVNNTSSTLQVFDVSNPTAPASVGSVATATGPWSVAVASGHAFVANNSAATMQVFRVTNPSSPTLVASVATAASNPREITVVGRYAYLISGTTPGTLQIFDIQDPGNPISTGTVTTGNSPAGITVAGRYAYVAANGSSTLEIYDISNPASPTGVGSASTGATSAPRRVVVAGRYAYVTSDTTNTLKVFDISNPATPTNVGTVTTGTGPYDLVVSGRLAYVANNTANTLETFDISNPASPVSLGTSASAGSSIRELAISGRYLYAVNQSAGASRLRVFDLGGTYSQSIEVGAAKLGSLSVVDDIQLGGNITAQGGLNVMGSSQLYGGLSVDGAVAFRNRNNSTTAFTVQDSSSVSLLNVDTTNKAMTVSSVAATALFSTKVDYATAASPLGAATADFDKDGDMDMAVANSGPNTVSVFMNNGNGTFAAKVDYAVGTSPSYIATADFDKDGDVDLAVTNYTVTSFSVFLNTGTGTFAAKADYTTDFTPFGITSADFDKDGDVDVAVANNDSDEVSVFMNDGTTDFDNIPRADYDTFPIGGEGQDPNGLVSGDLDRDGDIDLVTANDTSNSLSVMLNAGGTFNDVVEYSTGTTPTNLAIVDIDKDGDLDLTVANRGSGTVSVFRNNGNGTFAPKMDFTTASNPYSVIATDFDKDGDVDVAATNNGPGTVSVLINTTLAVSPTATPTLTLYSGGVNEVLQVRSTDDRRLLSVDARGSTTIGDVSNSTGTLFARKRDTTSGGIDHPYGITAGDIDKDGDNDLAVVALGSGTLDIYINNGNGNFGLSATYTVGNTPIDVAAGDFNKDGHIDFVVTNEADDTVSIVLNDGDSTFTVQGTAPATGDTPEGVVAADFDKDGDVDVVTANRGTGDNISVIKNNGSGTFAAKVDYAVGTNPYHIATADFDKDGDLDVVTANQSSSNASVLMNSGTGTFAAAVNYATGATATAVKTADFDKDGDIDFATGNSATISVFLNNGSGTFAAKVDYTSTWVQDMAVGDFDRDGDVDIAAADDNFPGHAKVFLNNGSGTFATPTLDHTTGDYPIAIVAADFDKDGDIDLATANEVTDNASVLLNSTINGDRFKVLSGDSMPLFTITNTGLQIGDGVTGVDTYSYGAATFLNPTNSTSAFRVLNASGGAALVIDTLNTRLGIGSTTPRSTLDLAGRKIFDVNVDQGNDAVDRYYHLGIIGTNNGEVQVSGILAAHTQAQGKGNIDIKFSGRDGFLAVGSVYGTVAGTAGAGSDIVVYYDGVSLYDVWLKTDQWALVNLDVTQAGATIAYDGTYQTTTPSGTLTFTLSTDTSPTILHMYNSGVFNTYGGGFNLNKNDSTAGLFVLDTKNTTGDPATGLTNGAMYYNSYTNRFRCYEDTRWTNCTSSSFEYDITDMVDDFLTGGTASGTAGSTGWSIYNSISGATLLPVAGVQNHPGITRIGSGTTTNNITSMVADGTNGVSTFVAGDADYFAAIVRPDSGTSTMSTRIGMLNSSLASGEASQGIYFSYTGSGNWRTVTRDATNITVNTTSTAYTAGTWYRLEIKRNNSGNWEFYINGTLQFTHSANIPSSSTTMAPAFTIETNNTTAKTLDIDWTRFRSRVLSR